MARPKLIAIITARGGSKRLPGKNIKIISGKPLIAWTIAVALEVKEINRVIVSTEDTTISGIARRCGAEVPFLRPPELAEDNTPSIDVVLHTIKELGLNKDDYILLLQPTSPLRTSDDIKNTISIMHTHKPDAVVSTTEGTEKPNGALYLNRVRSLLESKSFYPTGKTMWYIMPIERSIDIDTKDDFDRAEHILDRR